MAADVVAADVVAWRPLVPGVSEVFHARFSDHAYPPHTHDTWTLLLVDDGAVRYDLDRHAHRASRAEVTLLPPGVPHDGRSQSPGGFRKRVVYLDPATLGPQRVGVAVDSPAFGDRLLRTRVSALHRALRPDGDRLEAESRLALVLERLAGHLDRAVRPAPQVSENAVADRLREMLDVHVTEGLSLGEAALRLDRSPTHLIRAFTRRHGIPPHRYLTGRRIDRARRLLLDGRPAADVALETGFADQAHLTRHFRRLLGTTPAAYARSSGAPARLDPAPALAGASSTT